VPRAPGAPAVERHHRALIGHEVYDVRVHRADERVLIIVAAGRALERRPRLAAVDRLHRYGAGHDDDVGILRIYYRHREVAAADARRRTRIVRDLLPALARINALKDAHGCRRTVARHRRVQDL